MQASNEELSKRTNMETICEQVTSKFSLVSSLFIKSKSSSAKNVPDT